MFGIAQICNFPAWASLSLPSVSCLAVCGSPTHDAYELTLVPELPGLIGHPRSHFATLLHIDIRVPRLIGVEVGSAADVDTQRECKYWFPEHGKSDSAFVLALEGHPEFRPASHDQVGFGSAVCWLQV